MTRKVGMLIGIAALAIFGLSQSLMNAQLRSQNAVLRGQNAVLRGQVEQLLKVSDTWQEVDAKNRDTIRQYHVAVQTCIGAAAPLPR
jgi:hypothetical protein